SRRRLRQKGLDVLLAVRRDPLQPADGDRLLLEPPPAAGGLARAVAGAAQNAGKDVRLPVDQIGAVVVALRDPANIFRDRRVGRAGPLAVDDLMEVFWIRDVGRLHCPMSSPFSRWPESAPKLITLFCGRMFKKPALNSTQAGDLVDFPFGRNGHERPVDADRRRRPSFSIRFAWNRRRIIPCKYAVKPQVSSGGIAGELGEREQPNADRGVLLPLGSLHRGGRFPLRGLLPLFELP